MHRGASLLFKLTMALMSVFTAAPIFADPIISLDESGAGADFCDQFVGCRYNVSSSFSRGFFNSGDLVLQDGPGGPILDILDFGLGVVGSPSLLPIAPMGST